MIIGLLVLIQLILFAIGILGPWRDANATGRLPRAIRMLLSFSLVVAAFVIWLSGAKQATYVQWVAFGMLASFIGDLIMAKLIPLPDRLIGGMIAFGIAHILYITAYVLTIQANHADLLSFGFMLGIGFYAIVSIIGWLMLIRNLQKDTATNIGALVYGMLIGTMAAFALGLASAVGSGFWLTAIGGLFFITSDFLIGVTDIRGIKIKNANDWIWLTYVAGQAGIIYASTISIQ